MAIPCNTPATLYGPFAVELWEMIVEASLPLYPFNERREPTAGEPWVAIQISLVNSSLLRVAKKYVYRRCMPRMLLNGRRVFEDHPLRWPTPSERGLWGQAFVTRMFEVWDRVFVNWKSRAGVIGPHVRMAHWNWASLAPVGEGSRFRDMVVVDLFQNRELKSQFENPTMLVDRINNRLRFAERQLILGFNKFVNLTFLSLVYPFCALSDLNLPKLTQLAIIGTPSPSKGRDEIKIKIGAHPMLRFLAKHPLIRHLRLEHTMVIGVGELGDEDFHPILPELEVLIVAPDDGDGWERSRCHEDETCSVARLANLQWVSHSAPLHNGPGILETRVAPDYHLFSVGESDKSVVQWRQWKDVECRDWYVLAHYGSDNKPLHPWDYGPQRTAFDRLRAV